MHVLMLHPVQSWQLPYGVVHLASATQILSSDPTQYVCATQILVGNKCDIDESKRAVPYSKGQALANEFGIKFFETSAKSNINVEEVIACVPRRPS